MTLIIEPEAFDPRALPEQFYANPFPTYAHLREQAPVLRCPDGSYFLTRYDDVRTVYRDPHRYSSDKRLQFEPIFGRQSPLFAHHTTSLVFNDPPLHTQVRRAIGDALSARSISHLEQVVAHLVDQLLDEALASPTFDGISRFASAIPVAIIGDLLGVPEQEREPLRDWSLGILGALEAGLSNEALQHGENCVREFVTYLQQLIEARRASDTTADDVISRLLRFEHEGVRLSAEQLYHQCIFLLNAGHETTTNLIGNAIHLLLTESSHWDELHADPQNIDAVIEEVLRLQSPNQLGNRTTTHPIHIGGIDIPADRILTLCIGAANRDPAQFPNPDRFDPTRTPNPHLAFGAGIHTCAGLHVARLEARVALQRLLHRAPGLKLDGTPKRFARARFRGFETLPLRV